MKLKEIKPGMVIHCKTEEEANILFKEFVRLGYRWFNGKDIFNTYFENHEDGYGYHIHEDGTVTYDNIKYFKNKVPKCGEITPFSSLIIEEKTCEDGLNEAWEFVRKISNISYKELSNIFGVSMENPWGELIDKHSASEAIAKLEAYEAEKQIKVGDVVEYFTEVSNPHFGIYLSETKEEHWVLTPYCEAPQSLEKKTGWQFKKTGKHIDISSILAEIGKE